MGERVIVAVYTEDALKGLSAGLQDTVPVYSFVEVIVDTGVPPVTGAATPGIVEVPTTAAEVDGNTAVTTPELAGLVAVAPATVKKF